VFDFNQKTTNLKFQSQNMVQMFFRTTQGKKTLESILWLGIARMRLEFQLGEEIN
jgi:hypothetical protein